MSAPSTDDELRKAASDAMKAWAEHHRDENPTHTVWLHRRVYDLATACFDCERSWNERNRPATVSESAKS